MNNLISFVSDSKNSNIVSFYTISITVLVTWLIYRLGVWSQRLSVLKSISKELDLHRGWVGNQYTTNVTIDPSWRQPGYVVFKLSTIAIDNAISVGANIFLNKKLIEQLIGYRQRVNQFNQLIDSAINYQANVDLWKGRPTARVRNRMYDLICQIHWYGIGDAQQPLTYTYFVLANNELKSEIDSKILPIIWMLTNINLFLVKKLIRISLRYL